MIFKHFWFGILLRGFGALLFSLAAAYFTFETNNLFLGIIFFILLLTVLGSLVYFANSTNRKVVKFLETIRYSDFASSYRTDVKDKTFQEMGKAFNEVMAVFQKTRAEKEEQHLFLYTILQHIQTGIISFDAEGNVGILNNACKKLLQTPQIKNLKDVASHNPKLYEALREIKPSQNLLLTQDSQTKLALQATALKMGGQYWTIIAIQNIQSELQQNELDAWQNLTKVLRHEIMNSVTPISTLAGSLKDIMEEDVESIDSDHFKLDAESHEDMIEGLSTIANRTRGLIRFVDAYRDYTNIPKPELKPVSLKGLFQKIERLMQDNLQKEQVAFSWEIKQDDLTIMADTELIEMVLLNLVKNAKEALKNQEQKRILLKGFKSSENHTLVQVVDNGPGIPPHVQEKIFIPFFTTKKEGNGIGLALSRQILQMHRGNLMVNSKPDEETIFTLEF